MSDPRGLEAGQVAAVALRLAANSHGVTIDRADELLLVEVALG